MSWLQWLVIVWFVVWFLSPFEYPWDRWFWRQVDKFFEWLDRD